MGTEEILVLKAMPQSGLFSFHCLHLWLIYLFLGICHKPVRFTGSKVYTSPFLLSAL